MCHMFADTREELIAMAEAIEVNPKWIQKRGTVYEHFDISSRELVRKLRSRGVAADAPSSLQENKGASLPGLGLHGDTREFP